MSPSDAAPLPRLGEVFFDVRGDSRTMRLSWYADTGVAVFSIWQGERCTATFRLPIEDLPRMVEILRRGPQQRRPVPGGAALPRDRGRAEDEFDEGAERAVYQAGPRYGGDASTEYSPGEPLHASDYRYPAVGQENSQPDRDTGAEEWFSSRARPYSTPAEPSHRQPEGQWPEPQYRPSADYDLPAGYPDDNYDGQAMAPGASGDVLDWADDEDADGSLGYPGIAANPADAHDSDFPPADTFPSAPRHSRGDFRRASH